MEADKKQRKKVIMNDQSPVNQSQPELPNPMDRREARRQRA
jgi:hypothetical protein